MDRIYYFKNGAEVHVFNGGYLSGSDIKEHERCNGELTSVSYGKLRVAVDNRRNS